MRIDPSVFFVLSTSDHTRGCGYYGSLCSCTYLPCPLPLLFIFLLLSYISDFLTLEVFVSCCSCKICDGRCRFQYFCYFICNIKSGKLGMDYLLLTKHQHFPCPLTRFSFPLRHIPSAIESTVLRFYVWCHLGRASWVMWFICHKRSQPLLSIKSDIFHVKNS